MNERWVVRTCASKSLQGRPPPPRPAPHPGPPGLARPRVPTHGEHAQEGVWRGEGDDGCSGWSQPPRQLCWGGGGRRGRGRDFRQALGLSPACMGEKWTRWEETQQTKAHKNSKGSHSNRRWAGCLPKIPADSPIPPVWCPNTEGTRGSAAFLVLKTYNINNTPSYAKNNSTCLKRPFLILHRLGVQTNKNGRGRFPENKPC
jgi:hypothetical protein